MYHFLLLTVQLHLPSLLSSLPGMELQVCRTISIDVYVTFIPHVLLYFMLLIH